MLKLFKEQYSSWKRKCFPYDPRRKSRVRGSTVTKTLSEKPNMSTQQFFKNVDVSSVPKEFICEIW